MIFGVIDKPKNVFVFFHNKITYIIFYGTFRNNSLFFFLEILFSKQIAPASLFSFQLRIKTPFHKDITDDSVFLFKVKCIGKTQITHMEETEKYQWVIRLMTNSAFPTSIVSTAVSLFIGWANSWTNTRVTVAKTLVHKGKNSRNYLT